MIESVNLTLLEEYINGEISANDVLYEDGRPLSKSELDLALREFDDLKIHLKAAGLEKRLKSIHQDVAQEQGRGRLLQKWYVAAAILLIAAFSFLILRPNSTPEFSDYFSHFDQLITTRNDDNAVFDKAMLAYDNEDYESALTLFQKLNDDSLTGEVMFYAGVSALGSNNFEEAINYFKSAQKEQTEYYQQLRWYMALAYWQLNNIEVAIEQLLQIKEGEFKFEEAQELINHFD